MPDVVLNGPAGRIEARYHAATQPSAPLAIVLHAHPKFRGSMHHELIFRLFHVFVSQGFSVLRFNFRGVGRSQGSFDDGQGELVDAAASLDWLQSMHPDSNRCWVVGFSFGAWIGMQLLMRRPEIEGFVSVAPPVNFFDFSFLAPCPSSGLVISGEKDIVAPANQVTRLVRRLKTQKAIKIHHNTVVGANHFYEKREDALTDVVAKYVSARLSGEDLDEMAMFTDVGEENADSTEENFVL